MKHITEASDHPVAGSGHWEHPIPGDEELREAYYTAYAAKDGQGLYMSHVIGLRAVAALTTPEGKK